MLSYMRKNASSWIVKVLFTIIVVVFVFFYGFSGVRKTQDTVIASVGERKITMAEYRQAYKNMLQVYGQMYQGNLSDQMIESLGLKQKVLDQLIDRELLLQEAARLEMKITPEEVRKAILATPLFQQNGVFSEPRYQQVLGYYGITARDFERDKEKEILLKAMQDMITGSVNVSEKELRALHEMENEKVRIEYVSFDPREIKDELSVTDQELQQFYESHKESYRVPETIQVSYVVFDPKTFESRVEVSPADLEEYYRSAPQEFFEPEKVKARHILLKLDPKAAPEKQKEILEKAQKLLARLKAGEDFAELAKQYSEDTASAAKGGELGYFKRGDMVKEFESTAFSMKAGEISAPVKTTYGYHIIQVQDSREARTRPLEEVRDLIEEEIRADESIKLVRRAAKRAFNRLFKSRDLQGYAEKNSLKLNKTEFFPYGQGPEDQPGKELFSKEVFAVAEGALAPAFAIGEKYFLARVEAKQETHLAPLENISAVVKSEVKKEKRLALARQQAEKALAQLSGNQEDWAAGCKRLNLEAKEAEFRRQGEYIPGLGRAAELKTAVFKLKENNQLLGQAYQTDKGIVLARLKERIRPEADSFEKAREALTRTVVQKKQAEIFERFLQNLKEKHDLWVDGQLFSTV